MSERNTGSDLAPLELTSVPLRRFRHAAPAVLAVLVVASLGAAPAAEADERSQAEVATPAAAPVFVPTSSRPQSFVDLPAAGVTVFWASFEADKADLWRTDGTAEETSRLQVCPAGCSPGQAYPVESTASTAFFWIANASGGSDLWRTDGTVAGTLRLTNFGRDTRTGPVDPQRFAWSEALGRLVFAVSNERTQRKEIWTSDGSAAGTRRILAGGPIFSGPLDGDGLHAVGEKVFFLASREVESGQYVFDLWSSDATSVGTSVAITLTADRIGPLAVLGDRLLVATSESVSPSGCRVDLWSSRGTAATTVAFRSFDVPWCSPSQPSFQVVGELAVFSSNFTVEDELWRTDGTPAGTWAITDLSQRPGWHTLWSPVATMGGLLYFAANDGLHGVELWSADPNSAAPSSRLVADICPGPCWSVLGFLQAVGRRLFFQAGGFLDPRPWTSDGTAAGTRERTGLCAGCQGPHLPEHRVGDDLYSWGTVRPGEDELFFTDGATGAITRLTDLQPSQAIDTQELGIGRGTRFLFAADDGIHGWELWISDGTPGGTRLLVDLAPDGDLPDGPPPTPAPPSLTPMGTDWLEVRWDEVPGATRYRYETRAPAGSGSAVHDSPGPIALGFTHLEPGTPVSLRLRAENAFGASAWTDWVSATTFPTEPGEPCAQEGDTLCLRSGRFRVEIDWRDQRSGDSGTGRTLPSASTDRSGTFWFFKPDNVELIVKVLDGTTVNGYWWTFYGALTDVEYWITVTDVVSQAARTYYSPPGQVCGRGDTTSIGAVALPTRSSRGGGTAELPSRGGAAETPAGPVRVAGAAHPVEPCVEDGKTLCLLGGRFRVRVEWSDQHNGGSGTGDAVPFADRTGFFTFFNPNNVELVVKILDGTPVNGKIWVFYGALTDVGYAISVEDLVDGHEANEYHNPAGNLCGHADTAAF